MINTPVGIRPESELAMTIAAVPPEREIIYPETDGQPMADNTKQFRWIVAIEGNLEAIFRDRPDVFVAGDLLWYPVEGHPEIRRAPDAMVAFGRPKGDRGSYLQWREEGIAPQVVFEMLSPGNTLREMGQKLQFYDRYGVEEYYLYDPDEPDLSGWQRNNGRLEVIEDISGWVSPRLEIRFDLQGGELQLFRPNGQPFLTFGELEQARVAAEAQARVAEAQARMAEARVKQLEEQLRALGIEPDIAA